MRVLIPALFVALAACSSTGATNTSSDADASITDASISDASSADASGADGGPPCYPSGTAPPQDASTAEQLGVVGECCTTSNVCTSNSICVAGRCCIALRDSGRRCTVDSDCCSGQCPTQTDYDAGLISGECVAYPH